MFHPPRVTVNPENLLYSSLTLGKNKLDCLVLQPSLSLTLSQ
jgi:hypothetical protein